MHIIICVDNNFGMAFAGRRQSRDRLLLEQMLKTVGDNRLFITSYSAKLFEILPENIKVTDNLNDIPDNAYFFVEQSIPQQILAEIQNVVLYRWNKVYPSDVKFPEDIISNKKLVSAIEFIGNSHDAITEEIYK